MMSGSDPSGRREAGDDPYAFTEDSGSKQTMKSRKRQKRENVPKKVGSDEPVDVAIFTESVFDAATETIAGGDVSPGVSQGRSTPPVDKPVLLQEAKMAALVVPETPGADDDVSPSSASITRTSVPPESLSLPSNHSPAAQQAPIRSLRARNRSRTVRSLLQSNGPNTGVEEVTVVAALAAAAPEVSPVRRRRPLRRLRRRPVVRNRDTQSGSDSSDGSARDGKANDHSASDSDGDFTVAPPRRPAVSRRPSVRGSLTRANGLQSRLSHSQEGSDHDNDVIFVRSNQSKLNDLLRRPSSATHGHSRSSTIIPHLKSTRFNPEPDNDPITSPVSTPMAARTTSLGHPKMNWLHNHLRSAAAPRADIAPPTFTSTHPLALMDMEPQGHHSTPPVGDHPVDDGMGADDGWHGLFGSVGRRVALSRSAPNLQALGDNMGSSESQNTSSAPRNADRMWVDKHAPSSAAEVGVNPAKMKELRQVLGEALKPGSSTRLIIVRGPSGCGKTAAVNVLASEFGVEVVEWHSPVTAVATSNPEERYREWPTSIVEKFAEFVRSAVHGASLDLTGVAQKGKSVEVDAHALASRPHLVLIEDLPNLSTHDGCVDVASTLYWHVIRRLQPRGTPAVPVVLILCDEKDTPDSSFRWTRGRNARQASDAPHVVGSGAQALIKALVTDGGDRVSVIKMLEVAKTFVERALKRVAEREGLVKSKRSSRSQSIVSPSDLKDMALACGGDVRAAINALQFHSVGGMTTTRKSGLSTGGASDSLRRVQLTLMHSIGKFLHNKREVNDRDESVPGHHPLGTLTFSPEEVYEHAPVTSTRFTDFLHANYLEFLPSDTGTASSDQVADIEGMARGFSDADVLDSYSSTVSFANARGTTQADLASLVAGRSLLWYNRGVRRGVGFKAVGAPVGFTAKSRRAAKDFVQDVDRLFRTPPGEALDLLPWAWPCDGNAEGDSHQPRIRPEARFHVRLQESCMAQYSAQTLVMGVLPFMLAQRSSLHWKTGQLAFARTLSVLGTSSVSDQHAHWHHSNRFRKEDAVTDQSEKLCADEMVEDIDDSE